MGPVSCIGTTDTRVQSPETVVSESDRRFVLDNINQRLRLAKPLTPDDILAERCGVRPLAVKRSQGGTATQDWTALSRKHVIELDPQTGYMSIFGGKLTDCLNVGREVSEALHTFGIRLPFRLPEAHLPLLSVGRPTPVGGRRALSRNVDGEASRRKGWTLTSSL
jgi:glycerol-3-phosphate dehydrogenase